MYALAAIAAVLWLVSLGLTGFSYSGEARSGLEILLMGIPLGWMTTGGWAVYANIFFLWALVSVPINPNPTRSRGPVIAFVLATTGLPLFHSVSDPAVGVIKISGLGSVLLFGSCPWW